MARKHYGKAFDEYKSPSNSPKPSKPTASKSKASKPTKSTKSTKASKPTKKSVKKPSPYTLGTGLTQRVGSKIASHQKKTKARIDKMFKRK